MKQETRLDEKPGFWYSEAMEWDRSFDKSK